MFATSSRQRLTTHDLDRFPGESLFDRLARVVCLAECLPRKELFEAWEMARRVRRRFRGGRVVDLAAGHGLLAHVMLLLDDSSPSALAVDRVRPASSEPLWTHLINAWPRLAGRVAYQECGLDDVELWRTDIVVSNHACGRLTDVVLDRAAAARARVAVLPCCHDSNACDTGGLEGWMDDALAIDAVRAMRLQRQRYSVWTQHIPEAVTPKNRLLIADPGTSIDA